MVGVRVGIRVGDRARARAEGRVAWRHGGGHLEQEPLPDEIERGAAELLGEDRDLAREIAAGRELLRVRVEVRVGG